MKTNLGSIERVMRALVGLSLLTIVFVGPRSLWGLVGLGSIVTGLVGFCPFYRLVGVSTCPVPPDRRETTPR